MMAGFKEAFWIIFILCLSVINGQEQCPSKCYCIRTTVRCTFLQLDKVPSPIPPETTVLDLRFNQIRDIPKGAFIGLNKLNTLLLNNNNIKKLVNGAFEGLSELRYLYLYKNHIEKVESQAFSNLSKLRQLRLDSNELNCDCEAEWLSKFLQQKRRQVQATAVCKQPPSLQGRSVIRLTPSDFSCEKPRFIMQPQDANVTYGNTAYFSCRAEGNPKPQIIWKHNDNEVDLQDNRISQLQDGTLMIQSTKNSDMGIYQCIARTGSTEISTNKVQLTYANNQVQPRMTRTPVDQAASVGDRVQFYCEATGHPAPLISWTFNGNTLLSSDTYTIERTGSLIIKNVQSSHQGKYGCTATNDAGFVVAEAALTVTAPPTIDRPPADQSVVEGGTAMFRCSVNGAPRPNVTWHKGGSSFLSSDRRIQVLEEGSVLRIVRVQRADRGMYTCRGSNTAGIVEISAELSVTPQVSGNVLTREFDVETYAGGDIVLQCSPDGDQNEPTRWIKNGVSLITGNKYTLQGNRLIVRAVADSDFGRYECFAENTVGFARNVVNLKSSGRIPQRSYSGTRFVDQAIKQATKQVDTAINRTRTQLFNKNKAHTVQELLAIFRYPSAETLALARAEEIFEQTLEIINRQVRDGHKYDLDDPGQSYKEIVSPGHLELIANMSGCFANPRIVRCTEMCFHKRFRSMDGLCNNLENPTWGASVITLKRLLPPVYENGFNTPVGWNRAKLYNGFHLPSPRLVSSFMMSTDHVTQDERHTHMLMQWGQFLDHDISLTPQSVSNARFSDGRYCNETCENQYPCFPIDVPRSDTRIQNHACLGFSRSSAMCNSGSTSIFYKTFSPRQQINAITSFIDGSVVYGSSDFEAQRLREFTNGRGHLREGILSGNGKRLLPFDTGNFLHHFDCQIDPNKSHVPCFRAGDNRVNEQLALTAMHTLWMRQHNVIATELLGINPHWDGNMLYHESRKIIGALIQHITYKNWLPNIIGPSGMKKLGEYSGYNPNVDSSVSNEFATAAFRFGHSLVQPILFRLNESLLPITEGNLPLHKAFFSPYKILEEGGIDPLIRGLFAVSAKKRMPDEVMNSELTEKLFALANVVGQDLASLNIQRGRDHGLPFYNEYRNLCNLPRAQTFNDFSTEIPSRAVRDKLQALYGHPDNVDLFVGGMAEQPEPGAKVGPTFMCIMVEQFKRIRDGDRFWYENPSVFEPNQLSEIKQMTLARIICDSSDNIKQIQQDVFLRADNQSNYMSCKDIPKMNLKVWSECCTDCSKTGEFQSLTSHFRNNQNSQFTHREDLDHRNNVIQTSNSRDTTLGDQQYIKDQMKVLNDQVISFDSKMKGMENMVSGLTKTVLKLKRKMRKMTKQMQRHMNPIGCIDNKGKKRKENDVWQTNPCRKCQCRNDQVECVKEKCPLPQCTNPRKLQGQCCPIC